MLSKLKSYFQRRPPDLSGRSVGEAGEEWVSFLYEKKGAKILHRNYALYGTKKLGEIDIVCKMGKTLVLIEVKTRTSEQFMDLLETVDFRKQHFLRRMAKLYIQQNPKYEQYNLQIDVAAVLMNQVDNSVLSVKIVENAIEDT